MSMFKTDEMDDGIWQVVVNAPTNYTIYLYSRSSGTDETWASSQSSPLPIMHNCTISWVTPQPNITSKAQFLTWVCNKVGGGTLNVVDQQSTYSASTHSCG